MSRTLHIAFGRSRTDINWVNKEMSWEHFVNTYLKETKRTSEIFTDYIKMSKTNQDNIKDVGGFVGGKLKGSRRKKGQVEFRSIVTIDVDHGTPNMITFLEGLFNFQFIVYSTHKHTKEEPRLRIVIPLKEDISPSEYQVLCKILINKIGPHTIDSTTVEPERLMYFPSTAADGEYVFFENNSKFWCDGKKIIKAYPIPDSEIPKTALKKERGADKEGPIGAFCSYYSIQDVITTWLTDKYVETGNENRYTYVGGSTYGGLVIYENGEECYSHHSTDPAGDGHSHNAFDLLRIHKFAGDMDKCVKFVMKLDPVREDRLKAEFGDEFTKSTKSGESLDFGEEGLQPTINNYKILVRKGYNIQLNTFTRTIELDGAPWENVFDSKILNVIEKKYKIYSEPKYYRAVEELAYDNEYNPLKNRLLSFKLKWDGKPRIDTMFQDVYGVEDSEYVREVARLILGHAIRRVMMPGCQYQFVVVLSGPTGIGKSHLFKMLGMEWFNDNFQMADCRGKEGVEKLAGAWIVEIPELSGMSKASVEMVKAFITRVKDVYRPAYAKKAEEFPRQSIFVGTTNAENGYLKDITGNRRYLPIECKKRGIFVDEYYAQQIWAEAMYKELWKTVPDELSVDSAKEAINLQNKQLETDDKFDLVENYVKTEVPNDWYDRDIISRTQYFNLTHAKQEEAIEKAGGSFVRDKISTVEIWYELFNGALKDLTRVVSNELVTCLRKLGYTEKVRRNDKFYSKKLSCYCSPIVI